MHIRRILLAFSLAVSAASVAFADLVQLSTTNEPDRLEELTRTLSQGSYIESAEIKESTGVNMVVELRDKTIELNNASISISYLLT